MRRSVFIGGILLASCTSGSSSSGITSDSLTCPTDSTLTYDNFGEAFIADNCLSCHTSKDKPYLTTASDVRSHRQAIIKAAVTGTSMPKNTSMTTDERSVLGEWLTCGAP